MFKPVHWLMALTGLLSIAGPTAAQQAAPLLPENFPEITINVATDPSPGVIYLANMRRANSEDIEGGQPFRPFIMAINNDGTPAFIRPMPFMWAFHFGRSEATGQRFFYQVTQPDKGRGAAFDGVYRVLNDEGSVIRDYTARRGLPTQGHDFLMLENGHVLILSQPVRVRNLRRFGGPPAANLIEVVIQELDERGRIVFEWRSWQHVRPDETAVPDELEMAPPGVVSYMHGNGFTLDQDGHIILSARRFDELIKINRETGEIMWRMGGGLSQSNEFTFMDDPLDGFSGQHHPQILPNGNLLLFDNGTSHDPPQSRVVEYELDQDARTARLVWSYSDGRFSPAMGSAQRLPNGNTLIGWGTGPADRPNVTEVTPDGAVVFGLSLPPNQISYRAYRYDS